jgi:hypothetical protein
MIRYSSTGTHILTRKVFLQVFPWVPFIFGAARTKIVIVPCVTTPSLSGKEKSEEAQCSLNYFLYEMCGVVWWQEEEGSLKKSMKETHML